MPQCMVDSVCVCVYEKIYCDDEVAVVYSIGRQRDVSLACVCGFLWKIAIVLRFHRINGDKRVKKIKKKQQPTMEEKMKNCLISITIHTNTHIQTKAIDFQATSQFIKSISSNRWRNAQPRYGEEMTWCEFYYDFMHNACEVRGVWRLCSYEHGSHWHLRWASATAQRVTLAILWTSRRRRS